MEEIHIAAVQMRADPARPPHRNAGPDRKGNGRYSRGGASQPWRKLRYGLRISR